MKKIMFISRGMSYGGSGRCISVFSKILCRYGYKVVLLILRNYETEYEIDSKVQVIRLGYKTTKVKVDKTIILTKWITFIQKNVKREMPDVVIPFGIDASIITIITKIFTKSTVVVTIRSDPNNEPKGVIGRLCRNFFYYFSDYVWVQNEEQKNKLVNFLKNKTIIIPNPVGKQFIESCYKTRKNKQDITNFVTVGRLTKQKNQEMFILAADKISKKYSGLRFEIYGAGENEKELHKIIKELNLEEVVFLMGRTNEVEKALHKNDVFILTSNYEGIPNSLMEAMALEMPCISTNCPTGPSDLLEEGKNGILIDLNNVDDLCKGMEYFILNPIIAYEFGKNARNTIIKNYSEEIVGSLFINEIEKILKL